MLIYPQSFRDRFGAEMTELATQRMRRDPAPGLFARVGQAVSLFTDLIRSAPAQWVFAARHRAVRVRDLPDAASAYPRDNMDIIVQDLRFAIRGLMRRPGFTLVAALTLALGIGANIAIFSVVNAVLIRPLPYPNAERMVTLWGVQGTQGRNGIVYADYLEWRAQNRTFDDLGVYRGQSVNLTGSDTPDRLFGMFASESFMRLIGATPLQGRTFTASETEVATRAPVAVLGYEAWQSRFGADPAIIGKTLVLNGQAHTVIGITRPHLATPYGVADVYLPMGYYPNASGFARGNRGVAALGTIKRGVTLDNAQRDLQALARQQEQSYPETNKGFGIELQPLKDQLVGPTRGVPVVVVNSELAKKSWPNESAVGKRIQFTGDERWWTVVGVVGDSKHFALNETQLLQAYIPHAQRPQIFTTIAVRTAGDPLLLAKSIREAIWRVDRDQPVWSVRSMEQLLDSAVGSPKLIVRLTAGFAIVALLLGAIGIYGVLSYTMSQRIQEVGIRIALGADATQVVGMVVGEGMRIVGVAIGIGLVASMGATRLLRNQLFGVGPTDAVTFGIVTALLGTVAVLACYLPARRASRVDPMVALRSE
jgi:hypothetical protein